MKRDEVYTVVALCRAQSVRATAILLAEMRMIRSAAWVQRGIDDLVRKRVIRELKHDREYLVDWPKVTEHARHELAVAQRRLRQAQLEVRAAEDAVAIAAAQPPRQFTIRTPDKTLKPRLGRATNV